MMTFLIMLMAVLINMMIYSVNPMKMSFLLMILSSSYFMLISELTGITWFSILFFMLFMGGILIMMMILSSLTPNEKSMKFKMIQSILILIPLTPISSHNQMMMENLMEMKWFMKSTLNLQFTMIMIFLYFMIFMYMMTKENTPLRSTICFYKSNFVIY